MLKNAERLWYADTSALHVEFGVMWFVQSRPQKEEAQSHFCYNPYTSGVSLCLHWEVGVVLCALDKETWVDMPAVDFSGA